MIFSIKIFVKTLSVNIEAKAGLRTFFIILSFIGSGSTENRIGIKR